MFVNEKLFTKVPTTRKRNSVLIFLCVTDVNWTCGDHFVIYTNIKSLCYTPETDMICQLYLSKVNK